MPYKSARQRVYLHIHEPALAARWDAKYGGGLKETAHRLTAEKHGKKKRARG